MGKKVKKQQLPEQNAKRLQDLQNSRMQVFYHYLSLDIAYKIEGFKDFVASNEVSKDFTAYGMTFTVTKDSDGKLEFKPNRAAQKFEENLSNVKPISEYTDEEKLGLLFTTGKQFSVDEGKLALGLPKKDGGFYKLGGKGKLELYDKHVDNYHYMVLKSSAGHAYLIDMPTGSGKTMIVALESIAAVQAGINAIFTTKYKGGLVEQYIDKSSGLPAIAPDEITESFEIIEKTKRKQDVDRSKLFKDMEKQHDKPIIKIVSWSELLDHHTHDLLQMQDTSNLLLSFDEVHEAFRRADHYAEVIKVTKKFPMVDFLTATPTAKVIDLCGGEPTISIANKDRKGKRVLTEVQKVKTSKMKKKEIVEARSKTQRSIGTRINDAFSDLKDYLQFYLIDTFVKDNPSANKQFAEAIRTTFKVKNNGDFGYVPYSDEGGNVKESVTRFIEQNMVHILADKTLAFDNSYEGSVNLMQKFKNIIDPDNQYRDYEFRNGEWGDFDDLSSSKNQQKSQTNGIDKFIPEVHMRVEQDHQALQEAKFNALIYSLISELPDNPEIRAEGERQIRNIVEEAKNKQEPGFQSKLFLHTGKKQIVDCIYMQITGLNYIDFEDMRFNKPDKLKALLEKKFKDLDENKLSDLFLYNAKTNKNGFDTQTAELLALVATDLKSAFAKNDNELKMRLTKFSWLDVNLSNEFGIKQNIQVIETISNSDDSNSDDYESRKFFSQRHDDSKKEEFKTEEVVKKYKKERAIDVAARRFALIGHYDGFEDVTGLKFDETRLFNGYINRTIDLNDSQAKMADPRTRVAKKDKSIEAAKNQLRKKDGASEYTVCEPRYIPIPHDEKYGEAELEARKNISNNIKKRLAGFIVSNHSMSGVGLNMLPLMNVMMVSHNQNLSPADFKQDIGRARDLIPHKLTKLIHFIDTHKFKGDPVFGLPEAFSDKSSAAYKKAIEVYSKEKVISLASISAADFRAIMESEWNLLKQNIENEDEYIQRIFNKMIEVADDIDSEVGHNMDVTKQRMAEYLQNVVKNISEEIKDIKNPVILPTSMKVLRVIFYPLLAFIRSCYIIHSYRKVRSLRNEIEDIEKSEGSNLNAQERHELREMKAKLKAIENMSLSFANQLSLFAKSGLPIASLLSLLVVDIPLKNAFTSGSLTTDPVKLMSQFIQSNQGKTIVNNVLKNIIMNNSSPDKQEELQKLLEGKNILEVVYNVKNALPKLKNFDLTALINNDMVLCIQIAQNLKPFGEILDLQNSNLTAEDKAKVEELFKKIQNPVETTSGNIFTNLMSSILQGASPSSQSNLLSAFSEDDINTAKTILLPLVIQNSINIILNQMNAALDTEITLTEDQSEMLTSVLSALSGMGAKQKAPANLDMSKQNITMNVIDFLGVNSTKAKNANLLSSILGFASEPFNENIAPILESKLVKDLVYNYSKVDTSYIAELVFEDLAIQGMNPKIIEIENIQQQIIKLAEDEVNNKGEMKKLLEELKIVLVSLEKDYNIKVDNDDISLIGERIHKVLEASKKDYDAYEKAFKESGAATLAEFNAQVIAGQYFMGVPDEHKKPIVDKLFKYIIPTGKDVDRTIKSILKGIPNCKSQQDFTNLVDNIIISNPKLKELKGYKPNANIFELIKTAKDVYIEFNSALEAGDYDKAKQIADEKAYFIAVAIRNEKMFTLIPQVFMKFQGMIVEEKTNSKNFFEIWKQQRDNYQRNPKFYSLKHKIKTKENGVEGILTQQNPEGPGDIFQKIVFGVENFVSAVDSATDLSTRVNKRKIQFMEDLASMSADAKAGLTGKLTDKLRAGITRPKNHRISEESRKKAREFGGDMSKVQKLKVRPVEEGKKPERLPKTPFEHMKDKYAPDRKNFTKSAKTEQSNSGNGGKNK